MNRRVTIVMYHFVRDLQGSRFPEIKGLDSRDFVGQLEYILRYYNVVRMEDVIAAARSEDAGLPDRALLLTFDDGYADHYQTVFPLLDRLGLQGSFFPPAKAILERKVLDVNKIHFLLASIEDKAALVNAMEEKVRAARSEFDLRTLASYREEYWQPNRFDTAEVMYVKRLLQKGLPELLRSSITDDLFSDYVSDNEAAFANELYMSVEQIRCLHRHGMHIGSHSHDHYWLDSLDTAAQELQVRKSMDFLRQLGCDMNSWTMCYPYGAYDESLLGVLRREGCVVGLTTNVAIADLDATNRLELARIDTNDLPRQRNQSANHWTVQA